MSYGNNSAGSFALQSVVDRDYINRNTETPQTVYGPLNLLRNFTFPAKFDSGHGFGSILDYKEDQTGFFQLLKNDIQPTPTPVELDSRDLVLYTSNGYFVEVFMKNIPLTYGLQDFVFILEPKYVTQGADYYYAPSWITTAYTSFISSLEDGTFTIRIVIGATFTPPVMQDGWLPIPAPDLVFIKYQMLS